MTFQHLEVTPTAGDQRRSENKAQIGPDTLVGRYSGGQTEMSPLMRQLKKSNLHANARFLTSEIPTDKRALENFVRKVGRVSWFRPNSCLDFNLANILYFCQETEQKQLLLAENIINYHFIFKNVFILISRLPNIVKNIKTNGCTFTLRIKSYWFQVFWNS